MKTFDREEVKRHCLDFFLGDELAADASMGKYLMRNKRGEFVEKSPNDYLSMRIPNEFARIEQKYINPVAVEVIRYALGGILEEEMEKDPSLKNKLGYGVIVTQGSPTFGIGNWFRPVSVANCFVLGYIMDSFGGIHLKDEEISQICKRRGGAGVDISLLRPRGTYVNNASMTSSGAISFMKRLSDTTNEVGQAGRRGALMIGIDCRHPDVVEFINIKRSKNTVTGANISVKWHNDFFEVLEKGGKYTLRYPVDATPETAEMVKEIDAKELWDAFVDSAHHSAEPGCFFWDTVISQSISDCYANDGFKTIISNPCQPAWAKVLTRNGISTIGQIKEGDEIWSEDGWVKVMKKWSTGIKDVYKYRTVASAFYGTENHRVKENGEKIQVKDAKSIDFIAGPDSDVSVEFDAGLMTYEDWQMICNATGKLVLLRDGGDEIVVTQEDSPKSTYEILETSWVSKEEVFEINVDGPNHTYWTQGCNVSNCGEILMSEYNACLLMLLNAMLFVKNPYTKEAYMDWDEFDRASALATRLMDDLVDLEIEKIDQILAKIMSDPQPMTVKIREIQLWENVKKFYLQGRRTGLGITGLADLLAELNIKYDSEEALQFTDAFFARFQENVYRESAILAKERGPFPCWSWEKEKDCHYITKLSQETQDLIKQYGRRNIAHLTLSPAGTTSLVTRTSSGIEPVYTVESVRRRKLNAEEEKRGVKADEVDSLGTKWVTYKVQHPGFQRFCEITGKTTIEESPYYKCDAMSLDPFFRVRMQGVIQKHIDHSISSTCNLPADVSKETVSQLYLSAWKNKCKGLTIYRDGSLDNVIQTGNSKKTDRPDRIVKNHAPKRPTNLPSHIHSCVIKGQKWVFIVGMLEGVPYEIFGGKMNEIDIPKRFVRGFETVDVVNHKGTKNKDGFSTYDLIMGVGDDKVEIKDIGSKFSADNGTPTRLISMHLRHGTPLHELCEQIGKIPQDDNMLTFEKGISRILRKYIADKTEAGGTCPECKSKLIYEGGCVKCSQCPWSRCH